MPCFFLFLLFNNVYNNQKLMKKLFLLGLSFTFLFSSCVSQKQYSELETKQKETQDLLNSATVKLNSCLSDAAAANALSNALKDQLADLRKTNDNLIQSNKDLTMLTSKGASNVEKTLESLKEKDLKISRLQDAVTKKDSVMLALVTSLKKEVGINDPDIEVNVEKGVVFISIADKLLFKSGSYNVTSRAKEVLAKVAKVVKSKPDFEAMVEGHTDSRSYQKGVLLDNWDLSVKRSTSIIRVLQTLGVNPAQLIAAGRSEFVPLVDNDTAENRARNRRTRIIVLPKIDQFYDMIEQEMKNLAQGGN
jgi:chemotaxis protein MotB